MIEINDKRENKTKLVFKELEVGSIFEFPNSRNYGICLKIKNSEQDDNNYSFKEHRSISTGCNSPVILLDATLTINH